LLAVAVRTGAARVVAGERLRSAIARRRHHRAQRQEARFALIVDVAYKGHSNQANTVRGTHRVRMRPAPLSSPQH
jgi:hypothetical protein